MYAELVSMRMSSSLRIKDLDGTVHLEATFLPAGMRPDDAIPLLAQKGWTTKGEWRKDKHLSTTTWSCFDVAPSGQG